jgi:hypothetical protein
MTGSRGIGREEDAMKVATWLCVLALAVASPMTAEAAGSEVPQDVLERYWECRERHDLDVIRDLLWVHHNVERIDASIYGLPRDDFDDRSLLTIAERLDYRAEKAAAGIEMPAPGGPQYPHFLRKALDVHYDRTGERPDCSRILLEAGIEPEQVEAVEPGWPADLNLTSADTASRGEVHVAVDPDDPGTLVVTSVGSGSLESSNFLAVSGDWGATWQTGQVGNNGGTVWECDPATYYQRATGTAYHAKLACTTGTCAVAQVRVRRSVDDGITWTDCESRPGVQDSEDREWVVVDNTPTSPCYGTIYANWHNFGIEKVSYSNDQCATWIGPRSLVGAGTALGTDSAVAADGHAFVTWTGNVNSNVYSIAGTGDCGATWTDPPPSVVRARFGNPGNNLPAQCVRDVPSQPSIDVDRNPQSQFFGRVYMAMFDFNQACAAQGLWSCATWDANWSNPCNYDVWLAHSDDNGATWSAPVNLTAADGTNVDHFMGLLRVDQADGSVYLTYHRSRLNPASATDRQKTHYFVTRSIDGGATWEAPVQVSTLEGNQRVAGANVFDRGDYQAVDVAGGVVWPVWIDRRETTAEEEIVVRKICSEPAHWSERSPDFTPPPVEVFGNQTLTVRWTAPDVYWGDGDESPSLRAYQLWVDGTLAQDAIPWTATSTSYQPGDAATHSYSVRAINQCGISKDYAAVDHAVCAANPATVDVTPNGPLTVCSGTGVQLTATPIGGVGDQYQWYRDGAPVGGSTATYTAADSGTHDYNCEVRNAACGGGVVDLISTRISWQSVPLFGGLESVVDPGTGACALLLEWSAATPVCAGPVVYNVYRSETPGFTPGAGNLVAAAVTGTSYVDLDVVPGTTYFYVVRARDTSNAAEEANTIESSGAAAGAAFLLYSEDFESGSQGWQFALGTPAATTGLFVVGNPVGTVSNYGSPSQPEDDHTPTGVSCLYTAENPDGNAGVDDIDAGEVVATSPAINMEGFDSARLTLWRWFFNEDNDDAGDYYILEASDDDGASWIQLEEIPGSISNANRWLEASFALEQFVELTSTVRIRARAADGPATGDLVELAIDDIEITGYLGCLPATQYLLIDGFDSGDTSAWSATQP